MHFKHYGTQMLVTLLPTILIGTILLAYISCTKGEEAVMNQVNATMRSELEAKLTGIEKRINAVALLAATTSKMVGYSYTYTALEDYEKILAKNIMEEEIVLGSGIWFEPYVFDISQKFVGPYIYKEGDEILCTMDYSNQEYDYFNQEYYINALGKEEEAAFTEAYYDETSDKVMSSCSYPVYDEQKRYIGCVTVDIDLTGIQQIVESIQIGEKGKAFLLNNDGVYLSTDEDNKIMKLSIDDEENESLAAAGRKLLDSENGMVSYQKGEEAYNIYYENLPVLGWTLAIDVPVSQLNAPVQELMKILIAISAVIVIIIVFIILFMVQKIARNLRRVNRFATELAEGNFTIEPLPVKGKDEIAQMGSALNTMYQENKAVISTISEQFQILGGDSAKLHDTTQILNNYFAEIRDSIQNINDSMTTSSAATEELMASSQSVRDSIENLAQQTQSGNEMTLNIRSRAVNIEKDSQQSFEKAKKMASEYEINLSESIEKAKVVDEIGNMAEMISEIASQINMLSLNASIEAARAGEQGRGFAVVAKEIGKLANETATAVGGIRKTIQEISVAFYSLTKDAGNLIQFISENVTPDYNMFTEAAKKYGQDALDFEKIIKSITEMTDNIYKTMDEINSSIGEVAEAAQDTAERSGSITGRAEELSGVIEDTAKMAESQNDMSKYMDGVVHRFKLK